MRIKAKPFQVDPSAPFSGDALGRQESAVILTELVSSIDEPFVLAIDAGWGRGKSTFIGQWSAMLQKDGFHTLKFNAWENDFASDPLISFIGEIRTGLVIDSSQGSKQEEISEKIEIAKIIGGKILKRSIPVAAKIATFGALDLDEITEAAMAEAVSNFVNEEIESYSDDKNTLAEFKQNLEAFARLVTEKGEESRKPLVFFIDELDRCRPTYAVELLERLKHLFSVPGIVFVLAMDKKQIGHSICSMYGADFDATGYLRRFIDLDYSLPNPSGEVFASYLMQSYDFISYFGTQPKHGINAKNFVDTFSYFVEMFEFGLRDQEQIFSKLSIIFKTSAPHEILFIPALLFLLTLKYRRQTDYLKIANQEMDYAKIKELIPKNTPGRKFLSSIHGEYFLNYMKYGSQQHGEIQNSRDNLAANIQGRSDTSRAQQRLLQAIDQILDTDSVPLIPFLVRKIEISDRFSS